MTPVKVSNVPRVITSPKFSVDLDAYDLMSAERFHQYGSRRDWVSHKKRKELNRLTATQNTGYGSKTSWWEKYTQYIHSPRWKQVKERILRERGVSCERCSVSGSVVKLHLHHVSYARLGRELPEDVKLYCENCHALMHPDKNMLMR